MNSLDAYNVVLTLAIVLALIAMIIFAINLLTKHQFDVFFVIAPSSLLLFVVAFLLLHKQENTVVSSSELIENLENTKDEGKKQCMVNKIQNLTSRVLELRHSKLLEIENSCLSVEEVNQNLLDMST